MKQIKQRKKQMQREAYKEQQQGQQSQNQEASTQQTYQQKVDQRNQAIAQAILDAHNVSVSSNNLQAYNVSTNQNQFPPSAVAMTSTDVKDVVDLAEVWKKLDKKSTVWQLLIDDQSKVLTVSEYIDRYHQQGVKINEPPAHYVQMIDQLFSENPPMLQRPFGEVIQILAIIDYDFDNGIDKDLLAKKILGEAGFEANKTKKEANATRGV